MKNSKKLATLVLAVLLMAVLCSSAFAAGKKITLRIGSGHSETNPWIAALEDYFVPTVSERVAAETDYEIEWIKSYGGSVITLQNELQGIQDGLVDVGCMILVFEASRLPLQTMVYTMPFSCSDPNVVAKVVRQIYAEFPEFTTDYETKYNQKFIGVGVSDPYGLYSTKQIKSLEDVNGMRSAPPASTSSGSKAPARSDCRPPSTIPIRTSRPTSARRPFSPRIPAST